MGRGAGELRSGGARRDVIDRVPWLTLAVFVVTSVVTAAAYVWPAVGSALERSPSIRDGEAWRLVTTWLVNTDGWLQVLPNSLGLLVYGTFVEWTAGRRWWLFAYVVAGLTGEISGLWWQPVGAGNSVAVCGLIGLFSVWQATKWHGPRLASVFGGACWAAMGVGLLAHTDIHGAALAAGFGVGVLYAVLSSWAPAAAKDDYNGGGQSC